MFSVDAQRLNLRRTRQSCRVRVDSPLPATPRFQVPIGLYMKQLLICLMVLFGVLLFACISSAATYYVDQSGGSDTNSGTSPSTPWKNCPGMASYSGSGTLIAGDTVYFDSADTWLVTGTQGIYLTGGVTYIGDSWGSGTRAEIKANANLEAGVVRFRDHATYPTIFKGFNVNGNSKVTTGIDINHRYTSLMNGATKRVENSEVHHTSSRQASGQYKYGIIISNHGGSGGYAENVEVINNIVHDISRDAINLYPGDENASCRIKNITVRGNVVYNTGQDPDYSAGAGIIVKGYVVDAYIENNYVYGTKGAGVFVNGNETNHFGVGPTNIHFRYNIVNASSVHGGIRIYDDGADPKDIKIYGNILLNNTGTGGLSLDGNSGPLNLLVYNNTFYNAVVRFTNHNSTVNTLEFKNNIIYSTGATPLAANSGNIKSSSNNIYNGSSTLVTIGSTNYNSSNLTSFESTALSSNPLFVNTSNLPTGFTGTFGVNSQPNNDGLSLQPSSLAINSGATLAGTYAGSINSVARPQGAPWERGAYESVPSGADTTPPSPPGGVRLQ